MTWAFAYAAALVVGLALASVTGLFGGRRSLAHNLGVPVPDHHRTFVDMLGPRLAVGLILCGTVGLLLSARRLLEPRTTLLLALAFGAAGFLVAVALLQPQRAPNRSVEERATVLRDIPPGGYGQVRFERSGGSVVLAAHNIDSTVILAGSEVEVVDGTRSVVTVRKQPAA